MFKKWTFPTNLGWILKKWSRKWLLFHHFFRISPHPILNLVLSFFIKNSLSFFSRGDRNVPIYSKIKKILCCITWIVFIHFLGNLQNFLNSFSLLSWFKKWFSKPLPLLGPAALEVEKCFLNHFLNLDNREKVFSKFP